MVVTVTPTVVPTVSISATPSGNVCAGSLAEFTAVAVNGGTAPFYQWQVNGIRSGSNSNKFSSTALKNNDEVRVLVTSNAGCATPATATSNSIKMSLESVDAGANKNICSGSSTLIGAAPVAGYTYSWSPSTGLSAVSVAQPTATPSTTTAYIVTATTPLGCVTKDTVLVSVAATPAPPVITLSGNVLTSSVATGNIWYKDGTAINGASGRTYVATSSGVYTASVSNGCVSAPSNSINFILTGINSPTLAKALLIGPNPVSELLTIQYNGAGGQFRLQLLDITGRKELAEARFNSSYHLQMKHFGAGVYILKIINQQTGEQTHQLIIKN
jgi:hypothetical protein